MRIHFLFLLILLSCATREDPAKAHAIEEWKGQASSTLSSHPYFRTLPLVKRAHQNGVETWVYRDQSKFQTQAYCQSLGGCVGLPAYSCDHAFSVKDGIILGYDQAGTCPDKDVIEVSRKSKE